MSALGAGARTLLAAYDPANGRRPDLQRLGPIVRAAILVELVDGDRLQDQGDTVIGVGQAPTEPVSARVWQSCQEGIAWRRAVGRGGRETVHAVEAELADAGLVTLSRRGFGPFSSTSASPTARGQEQGAAERERIAVEVGRSSVAAAIVVGVHAFGIAKVLGDTPPDRSAVPEDLLPPGLVKALERAALDRRVMLTG